MISGGGDTLAAAAPWWMWKVTAPTWSTKGSWPCVYTCISLLTRLLHHGVPAASRRHTGHVPVKHVALWLLCHQAPAGGVLPRGRGVVGRVGPPLRGRDHARLHEVEAVDEAGDLVRGPEAETHAGRAVHLG